MGLWIVGLEYIYAIAYFASLTLKTLGIWLKVSIKSEGNLYFNSFVIFPLPTIKTMFSPKIIPQCTTGIFITTAFIIAKSQLFGLPTFAIEVIAWLNKNWLKSSHETGLIISLLLVLGKIPLVL